MQQHPKHRQAAISTTIIGIVVVLLTGVVIGWFARGFWIVSILSPLSDEQEFATTGDLRRFSFQQLRNTDFQPTEIELGRTVQSSPDVMSRIFTYTWEGQTISGLANIPRREGTLPVVVMLRGFVDRDMYQTGVGTARAGEVFAQHGFITLAPDFLGFGESDPESSDGLRDRFSRPAQVLQLIASVQTLPQADTETIFLWGHSNGGQIALSVLEITRANYPTTLWAPVSKPFPYSILYYTDEFSDGGRYLRRVTAEFEQNHNPDEFSIHTYYQDIVAPIQLHQGGRDEAVPQAWSDELADRLQEVSADLEYFVYPGADHNMVGSWNTVVARDLAFFRTHMQ